MTFVRRSVVSLAAFALTFAAVSWASQGDAQAQGPRSARNFGRSTPLYGGGYAGQGYTAGYVGGGYVGGGYGGGGYGVPGYGAPGYGYTAPIYHAPSVHTDLQYHADSLHWTPGRGLHTHGHYDAVPHYTPGHLDTNHNGHIHGNPYYHH